MSRPRVRLRTLMIAVVVAALASCVAFRLTGDERLVLVCGSPPALFLLTCAFLLVHYRHL